MVRHLWVTCDALSADGSTGDVVNDDTVSAMASINLTGKLTARLDSNVSWFNFQGVTTSTLTSDNSDQRFLSIRPSLTYQILRPWGVSVAYIYEYTDYTDSTFANYSDHRLFLSTQYALREWLVLGLSYRYGARRVHGNATAIGRVDEFTGQPGHADGDRQSDFALLKRVAESVVGQAERVGAHAPFQRMTPARLVSRK